MCAYIGIKLSSGVILLRILYIYVSRLHYRRSESVSPPRSSYKLIRLEPCQVHVMANAASY